MDGENSKEWGQRKDGVPSPSLSSRPNVRFGDKKRSLSGMETPDDSICCELCLLSVF